MPRLCNQCLDAYTWPADETDPGLCRLCDALRWLRLIGARAADDRRLTVTLGKAQLDELRAIVRRWEGWQP
jgi:hypothetical protein